MVKKQGRRKVFKLNNNGSTMMIVLVAVALISVLATVLMAMSYMNYNMKVTELNSKKNFYTAETVLDQINVGLQSEISASVEDAYIRSMQRYTLDNDVVRNTNFANYYIGELRNRLRTVDADSQYQIAPLDTDLDGVYDSGLVQYLDSTLQAAYTAGTLKITSTDAKMESVAIATTNAAGDTVYESQGLILYNLRIEYTDAKEYTSVIETDIRLKTPSLTLVTKTAMPDVFDYSLVADAGIVGASAGSTVTFDGNVYGGGDTASTVDLGGIAVTQGHNWTFTGDSRVVSGGPVSITQLATMTTESGTENWFESIELIKTGNATSGTLNLAGYTYVADDLTIEGNGAQVEISGNYYGYGNGYNATTDSYEAAKSSSIILNGKNATLDMSGLDKLMLGGNAYIQTSKVTYSPTATFAEGHNTDILMGNSLAVKSDQIAYLVPAECIGVNNGTTVIGRNPMTESEYQVWSQYLQNKQNNVAGYENYEAVSLTKEMDTVEKSLSQYDYSGTGYKTVFRQVNGQSICYVYLDLTAEGAAEYYQDYYSAASTKMDRYIQTYNNRVLINPDMDEFDTKGTVLSYALGDNGDISIIDNTMDASRTADELNDIAEEQQKLQGRFERLLAKLTLEASNVTSEELSKTVYANLINDAVMSTISPASPKCYELEISATEKIKAVFVNNRGGANYVYSDTDICVIVATGNVELTKDFSGVLICDGKVYINNGVMNVTTNKSNVLRILRSKESNAADAKSIIATYFNNGDKYSMDSTLTGEVTNSMAGQQISDLIVYENWTKQ